MSARKHILEEEEDNNNTLKVIKVHDPSEDLQQVKEKSEPEEGKEKRIDEVKVEGERPHWYKYATEALRAAIGQEVNLRDDVTNEELGLTKKQRHKIEKLVDPDKPNPFPVDRQNWFMRDTISGNIYLVKQCYDTTRSYKEWLINKLLFEFKVPNTIPAVCWFKGRQDVDDPLDGFLVVPYIKAVSLGHLLNSDDFYLTSSECIHFFQQILETFAAFDPHSQGSLQIIYRDFNFEQILRQYDSNQWYLIDFGLADAKYSTQDTGEIKEIFMTDSFRPPKSNFLELLLSTLSDVSDPWPLLDVMWMLPNSATVWLAVLNEYLQQVELGEPKVSTWVTDLLAYSTNVHSKCDYDKVAPHRQLIIDWLKDNM